MSNFMVPNTFIPGTKAKAQEVNENFSAIKDELNSKIDLGGDSNTVFSVATATEAEHAVNKLQAETMLSDLKDELVYKLSGYNGHIFAINGNVDSSGNADVIDISGNNLYFKVGNGYDKLEIYTDNTNIEISNIENFDITGFADGNYNIFVDKDANIYVLNNKIYIQPNQPTLLINDVWVDTSCSPAVIKQSTGSELIDFKKVAIGKFTLSSSNVSNLQSYPFNSKFVSVVNHNSTAEVIESYSNGTSWYRIYSDGWCEQGGQTPVEQASWVTFMKPYLQQPFVSATTSATSPSGNPSCFVVTSSVSTASFYIASGAWGEDGLLRSDYAWSQKCWKASGYIS